MGDEQVKLPSLPQMKARAVYWHYAAMREAVAGVEALTPASSPRETRAYWTAVETLFRWGCIETDRVSRDAAGRLTNARLVTDRGRELYAWIVEQVAAEVAAMPEIARPS